MAAIATHKRRPVAPTKYTQKVNLNNLDKLRPETSVEAYHQLFVNIELAVNPMLEHGVQDEIITIINTARLAQYARELSDLDKYLEEIVACAYRWNAENERIAKTAEQELYSPEATIARLRGDENPRRLLPPEGGGIVTLNITARLSNGLLPSSAKMLKAEQVYGPFWNIKAKCFIVRRGAQEMSAPAAFVAYRNAKPKVQAKDYRLLPEYKVTQTRYRNVDIFMLVDLPRLVALRDTKILELGLATRAQLQQQDMEERLPIIERAEAIAARMPRTVSAESKRYMVHRLVETMLLDEKRTRLRNARYARDGIPKVHSAAAQILNSERFKISNEIAERAGAMPQEVHLALTNKTFSNFIGVFLRLHGREGWAWACTKAIEWQKLRKLAESPNG